MQKNNTKNLLSAFLFFSFLRLNLFSSELSLSDLSSSEVYLTEFSSSESSLSKSEEICMSSIIYLGFFFSLAIYLYSSKNT